MKCPACEVPLALSERQGVEIDYCPRCRGIWLDRGELDKILDRAGGGARPRDERDERRGERDQRESEYRDPRSWGHGESQHREHSVGERPRKRREGWLAELFDFD